MKRGWFHGWGGCLAGCLAVGLGCVSGCHERTGADQTVRLAPLARPFEPDIPVPVGFRFVEASSEDRSTGTARLYLRHVYEGAAAKVAVRSFYREHMPLSRWVNVSDGNVKGEYTLRYEKGTESCTVLIRDREGWRGGSEVQVIISQEQRGASPPKARNRS